MKGLIIQRVKVGIGLYNPTDNNRHGRYSSRISRKLPYWREDEQQQEFNRRIRTLVYGELVHLRDILKNIIEEPNHITFTEAHIMFNHSREYPKMPLEKRAMIFDSDMLDEIESAYTSYENFSALFNAHYEKYAKGELRIEVLITILNTEVYKSAIDRAINVMYERTLLLQ